MANSWLQVAVHKKYLLAEDILGLELKAIQGEILPPVEAGAHIDVKLPNGITRKYSLTNAPDEVGVYKLGILLDPNSRGGSAYIHWELRQGDELLISVPCNYFPLVDSEHALLFAGGIGITPIFAMAESLYQSGKSFELHYACRSESKAAFLNTLLDKPWADRVSFYFNDANQKIDAEALIFDAELTTHLYCCGPSGFINWINDIAVKQRWSADRIHFERFNMKKSETIGQESIFEIRLQRSDKVIEVGADQTVAQTLLDHGIDIALSCEQGICGSCMIPVLEGIPDHRDMFQSEAEKKQNNQFTPCCSRSHSQTLVLDI
ncbi:oxidoreductase [Marinomonas piezotolerans]|uniref:Oxidoreductase n=1 Tax=Marinomonas piezotolerans TaxID=2213058 RepID=A0A370UCV3_9GAMM|nr:PDR/VanB family oxidoreductase [Marinomonas piezotolerans]RDL45622.1 oxidoreductase [Marinomonas piezotolerans]